MEFEELKSKDNAGNEVLVYVKKPGMKEYREAQLAYNKAFREALENGAILKEKLNDFIRSQGLWDDHKEKEYLDAIEKLRSLEDILSKGGIPLSQAKSVAIDMRRARSKLQGLMSKKFSYDNNSAEGLADGARFNQLTLLCVFKPDRVNKVWKTLDDYDRDATQPWAIEAVSKLSNLLYGYDPNAEKNLPENKFLIKYKLANENLELINKDGHLVDLEGRLIDEEGYYIKYNEDGVAVRITKDGKELDENGELKVEFQPFLDDDGNPIE